MNFALMSDMRLAEVSRFAHHLFHPYQEEEDALMLGILPPPLPSHQILQLEPLVLHARPQLPEGGVTVPVDFQEMGVGSRL